jgi:hypothetical protein
MGLDNLNLGDSEELQKTNRTVKKFQILYACGVSCQQKTASTCEDGWQFSNILTTELI